MHNEANGSALVLGGGGPLGVAWQAGILQGWAEVWAVHSEEALSPLLAGKIIGTSGGAIVGAHLAVCRSVSELIAQQAQTIHSGNFRPAMAKFFAAFLKAKLLTRDLRGFRRSLGQSALRSEEQGDAWTRLVAKYYSPSGSWPLEPELQITVIDAETGDFLVWSASSGKPLPLAIAASCSVPCAFPLVRIDGRAFIDGGLGSSTNAEVAEGCARVVILDPLGNTFGLKSPLNEERKSLEAKGSRTLAILPDRKVGNAIGKNFLDLSRCAVIAKLGIEQGRATAQGTWNFLHAGIATQPAQSAPN